MQPLIPITVLTGYLGSGKTTLLNHLLTHNERVKFGVIVNDFGDINIDAQLVEKQTDTALQLTNGCICCSLDVMGLEDALKQFVYPDSPIEYILIEASGLAESADLSSNFSNTFTERLGVRLDSIVCVIDAEHIEQNAREHATALQQIEYANFIVINKTDLVDEKKLADIRKMIAVIKPKLRVIETTHGAVDLHLILDQDAFESLHPHEHHAHDHEHLHFQTTSFVSDQPLDPIAFQDFVNNHLPLSIYRAKGFVDMGEKVRGMQCIFQLVGSRATITWDKWGEETPRTQLVFIGQEFDENALLAKLKACIDTSPAANADQSVTLPGIH